MSASDTELVRMQRQKHAILSNAIRSAFAVVAAALAAAIDSGTASAWVSFGIAVIGSVLAVLDRWFAEGPLILRRPGGTIVVQPPHDPEAR